MIVYNAMMIVQNVMMIVYNAMMIVHYVMMILNEISSQHNVKHIRRLRRSIGIHQNVPYKNGS